MTAFDVEAYGKILKDILPQVIKTEEEYERILPVVEKYTFNKNLTPEETVMYRLLVQLVEAYEREHYPMDKSKPHEILQHVMESSGTTKEDLVRVLGKALGYTIELVEDLVSGATPITVPMATILGKVFRVKPELFL